MSTNRLSNVIKKINKRDGWNAYRENNNVICSYREYIVCFKLSRKYPFDIPKLTMKGFAVIDTYDWKAVVYTLDTIIQDAENQILWYERNKDKESSDVIKEIVSYTGFYFIKQ